MIINYLQGLLSVFLIPLSWLPTPIGVVLSLVVSAFALFTVGRIFKWVWDALPIA